MKIRILLLFLITTISTLSSAQTKLIPYELVKITDTKFNTAYSRWMRGKDFRVDPTGQMFTSEDYSYGPIEKIWHIDGSERNVVSFGVGNVVFNEAMTEGAAEVYDYANGKRSLRYYDVKTGSTIWEYPSANLHQKIILGDFLVFGADIGTVVFDTKTRKEIWKGPKLPLNDSWVSGNRFLYTFYFNTYSRYEDLKVWDIVKGQLVYSFSENVTHWQEVGNYLYVVYNKNQNELVQYDLTNFSQKATFSIDNDLLEFKICSSGKILIQANSALDLFTGTKYKDRFYNGAFSPNCKYFVSDYGGVFKTDGMEQIGKFNFFPSMISSPPSVYDPRPISISNNGKEIATVLIDLNSTPGSSPGPTKIGFWKEAP